MIKRYGNSIINLSKVVRVDLYKKNITFTIQSRGSIAGSFFFFGGGENTMKLYFETEDIASKEFNDINDDMSRYYKK